MTDKELALAYAPMIHFDSAETIPLRAVGYSILRQSGQSPSFRRVLRVPAGAMCLIEYAYYWDYDIQHMYDLEHIWVTVGQGGEVLSAEASFHGKFFLLWQEGIGFGQAPTGTHVHADCQPGKHAFMPDGRLFRLLPDWREACQAEAGGGVLVGYPFQGAYAPTDVQNALSERYIKRCLTFAPTLVFDKDAPRDAAYMPWAQLKAAVPAWIKQELNRIASLEG